MCYRPDVEAEGEHLDRLVLAAFEGFKCYMRTLFVYVGDEKKPDWIKTFLEALGGRLRTLEKEGKLADRSKDNVNAE